jgi:tetratricopeptide (TPR) repeat protein
VIPVTPTPDLRGREELFSTARQQFSAQDWDNFMTSVDALRGLDPKYRSIDVDGMLYVAYRFRGMRKIYQEANLEGGIYDLALAERYAPLDADAKGARNWARLYLNGVSFWGADWARVVTIFEQIYPYFPNLRDASGLTATERYRQAAVEQGKVLVGRGDGCGALEYFDKALAVAPDAAVEQRAAEAYQVCYPPTETPGPTETPTITVPVETNPAPVVEVTETPTPGSNP